MRSDVLNRLVSNEVVTVLERKCGEALEIFTKPRETLNNASPKNLLHSSTRRGTHRRERKKKKKKRKELQHLGFPRGPPPQY